jgi:ketosteroid isomerase-like protein
MMSQNTANLESELNAMIQKGEIMAAFEKYYAEDVVMQENSEPPFAGKTANRAREQAFVDSVGQVHAIKVVNSAVSGDVAFSEWLLDVTFRNGQRAQMAQVAVRRWKNDRVVHERFYYNKG